MRTSITLTPRTEKALARFEALIGPAPDPFDGTAPFVIRTVDYVDLKVLNVSECTDGPLANRVVSAIDLPSCDVFVHDVIAKSGDHLFGIPRVPGDEQSFDSSFLDAR